VLYRTAREADKTGDLKTITYHNISYHTPAFTMVAHGRLLRIFYDVVLVLPPPTVFLLPSH
jgi:hypothetical protein